MFFKFALVALLALPVATKTAIGACFEEAGARYGVSPLVLRAIQRVENPKGDPSLMVRNTNGTYDHGLMGINSIWLKEIGRYGYTKEHLLDPCLNVVIAAWILGRRLASQGTTWQSVGLYHSNTPALRDRYAMKVRGEFVRMGGYQ